MGTTAGRTGRAGRTARALALVGVLVLAAVACDPRLPAGEPTGTPSATSALVGCERADQLIALDADAHLDPTCTYTRGLEIVASNTTLDCRGARIVDAAGNRPRGVHVHVPVGEDLTGVVVRNCFIEGFTNTIRVSRDGFQALEPGAEYLDDVGDITIENNHLSNSRGSGIFVNAYVTDVTIQHNEITGAGSVGIYLEASSRDSVVADNHIHHNGFATVDPAGYPEQIGGTTVLTLRTGREGIAIDGSSGNEVVRNNLHGNAAGGIFLYKNCGEFVHEQPSGWWERRYGADDNLVAGNLIADESNGIWVGSRMAENQYFMDCSDPTYVSGALQAVHRDVAQDNTIRDNTLVAVDNAIRVEDDGTTVTGNVVHTEDPAARGVLVGTKVRTQVLGEPVDGTTITDNAVHGPAGVQAYGWVHGHTGTTFSGNQLNDAPVAALGPGTQPTIDPFLFVISVWYP